MRKASDLMDWRNSGWEPPPFEVSVEAWREIAEQIAVYVLEGKAIMPQGAC